MRKTIITAIGVAALCSAVTFGITQNYYAQTYGEHELTGTYLKEGSQEKNIVDDSYIAITPAENEEEKDYQWYTLSDHMLYEGTYEIKENALYLKSGKENVGIIISKGKHYYVVDKDLNLTEVKKISDAAVVMDELVSSNGLSINVGDISDQMTMLQLGNTYQGEELAKKTVEEVVERKAMVKVADDAGYELSDEEYEAYIKALKTSLKEAENKDEIKEFFDSIGGEEEYFNATKNIYKDNLLISKYLDDQQQEYLKQDNTKVSKWPEQEEKIKQEAIKALGLNKEDKTTLLDYALDYVNESEDAEE